MTKHTQFFFIYIDLVSHLDKDFFRFRTLSDRFFPLQIVCFRKIPHEIGLIWGAILTRDFTYKGKR